MLGARCIWTSPWTTSSRPRSRSSCWALCVFLVGVRVSGSTATRPGTRSVCAFRQANASAAVVILRRLRVPWLPGHQERPPPGRRGASVDVRARWCQPRVSYTRPARRQFTVKRWLTAASWLYEIEQTTQMLRSDPGVVTRTDCEALHVSPETWGLCPVNR
jgi:hypothetical protein